MKKIYLISALVLLIGVSGCDKFLDQVPDKRTEIDTNKKVGELLVSAYPNVDPMMIYEHRTDNVMDNGIRYGQPNSKMVEENYYWKDISETDWDAPEALWNSCYRAIASCNEALESIKKLGESKENAPYKAEALLCRAYAHFLLANTFCQPYSKQVAETALGIPYVEVPEKYIGTTYERGTLASVYQKIAQDIETAFPLLNDNVYAVPAYHFNTKAAAAFATRFYLYYENYTKSLEYANKALGEDPSGSLRNFAPYAKLTSYDEWGNRFISKDDPANLLLIPLRSRWGRDFNSERFGNSTSLVQAILYRSSGPWGISLPSFDVLFHRSGYPVSSQPKYVEIFEIKDQAARTGQPHVVQMAFTTDEALLCRAEAKIMLQQYDSAAQDLSYWYTSKGGASATAQQIVQYYTDRATTDAAAMAEGKLPAWFVLVKPLHPKFEIQEGQQEKMLQAVLHARQIETLFSGLRWLDIRRFGIEVVHNREDRDPIVLTPTDPRRVIQLPSAVVAAGLQANPK